MRHTLVFLSLFFISIISSAQIIYVTVAGAGLKNGSSWANAFDGYQFADTTYTFTPGTQVWIAAGTYLPTKKANGAVITAGLELEATFLIRKGVKFYGGFAGTESSINDRILALIHSTNETILSGDFGIAGNNGDNSYFVLTMTQCGDGELLDGITEAGATDTGLSISFTAAANSAVTINNCVIRDNFPLGTVAGISCSTGGVPGASINILNSHFVRNGTSFDGNDGAIVTSGCVLNIANCIFYSNSCQSLGSTPANCIHFANVAGGKISNCTFFNNFTGYAIVLSNVSDSVYINNSIFWGNDNMGQVGNVTTTVGNNRASVKNCIFEAQPDFPNPGPAVLLNSVSANPLFVNTANPAGADNVWGTADDGLELSNLSPGIDNGKNEFIPPLISKDILGNARVIGCRVDIGAYEYLNAMFNTNGLYNGIGQSCTSFPVSAGSTNYVDSASCHEMTTIIPAGANPINGPVQVCVTNNATVPVVNGVPFVPRHYDISPANSASTATARITIYFTQQDFNLYNAATPAAPHLPVGPADVAGIANIMIEQDHGFSATGVPGTYNGTTVFINPNDNDIVWNAANGYWEISFDVTGFSGFFMTTITVAPVELLSFSGKINNQSVNLFWTTTLEINVDRFDIRQSSDGKNFITIGNRAASGIVNGSSYSFNDKAPIHGRNYYQLVSVDVGGSKQYSNIIQLDMAQAEKADFTLTPNPSHTLCLINISGVIHGKTSIVIYDLTGKQVLELYAGDLNSNAFSKAFSVANLKKGIYIVSVQIGNDYRRKKLVVE